MNFLKRYPIPIAGLILSIFALGNLLQSYNKNLRLSIGIIGFVLILAYIIKIIFQNIKLKEEFMNPIPASVFLTFTMATILLAGYIKQFSETIGIIVWYMGIIGHVVLVVWFSMKFLNNFSIKKVFPSWFIVYVGIAVASVTASNMSNILIGKITFYFSFVLYLCILPVVCYRVWKVGELIDAAKPTLIILAAPASLLLAGYLSSFEEKNIIILYLLTFLSFGFYIIALYYLPRLLKLKFTPGYSAFTFPLVISAIACKMLNLYFKQSYVILKVLTKVEEVIAILIVSWVLVCYLFFLFRKDKA
ncbi:MAG: TDT family transporter [Treponema sp.]